jgi:hypothetical protein
MLMNGLEAASSAFEAGYEGPSQSSREDKTLLRPTPNAGYQGAAVHQAGRRM